MSSPEKLVPCPGCGAMFRDFEGPVHRYLESSPGCWEAFGHVLEREYSNAAYAQNHGLTVDAFAVQHPGRPSRQSIQSVGLHLIRLCLYLERGLRSADAHAAMLTAAKAKHDFVWLEPPPSRGDVTVREVLKSQTAEEHCAAVQRWAESAWQAWKPHHETVRTRLSMLDRQNHRG